MKITRVLAPFLIILLLFGCAAEPPVRIDDCRVVLEEGEGFTCADHTKIVNRGDDATFFIELLDGYAVTGADHEDVSLTPSQNGGILVTLRQVRYSTVITLTIQKSDTVLIYDPNDGTGAAAVSVSVTPSHLRRNTAAALFSRDGHTLIGWNTMPDGSGIAVGLGSRIDPDSGSTLYAQWRKWSDAALFQWEITDSGITVTGYTGAEDTVVIPAVIGGNAVTAIASGAFENAVCHTAVLPESLNILEAGAFSGSGLTTLYLFDNIRIIGDPGVRLRTLRINASEAPVYSGTYYDTFQDKYDRLLRLKDEKKIVLFSGSSTRFGYDSALLQEAFPDYAIVNMGVFAYSNALPQMELILRCMKPGDVLIHMPEFDSAADQFCADTDLDEPFFCMMESNYDTLTALDLREYTNIFPALEAYLTVRDSMEKRSYGISPSDYDEDGNPVDTPSYNVYGDYTVYRPNAASDRPVYGLPVHYTVSAFPEDPFLTGLNGMYRKFQAAGVLVLYTYSPRNSMALSENSTPEARAALDAYLREKLCVPFISELEDSLWSGTYLYGTDNHLSTEGAAIHTRRLIPRIRAALEEAKEGIYG